ncbi:hypothetical protein EDE04_3859 [Streptomyces sp. 2132.2]|nr:hypothetical protein EDE04_3859 [Streptomyces sp. 2132.2]
MVRSSATDARQREYLTYAPQGERCPVCRKAIESLELVERGTLEGSAGPTVVVYRHTRCPLESE